MTKPITWQYDEFRQVGKDYSDPAEVDLYDASHSDFRDLEGEADALLERLALPPAASLIDFGCGTGSFAIRAAASLRRVTAVDVSEPMLQRARAKAKATGADNIAFCHGGFLTYEHPEPVDAITTTYAFHHLPDFWKGIALPRLHAMLKPGGLFYLGDAIIAPENCLANIDAFIGKLSAAGGSFMREDAEMHFREEFSTYDWIIDGLLERAGFTIVTKTIEDGVFGHYLCRKD